MRIAKLVSVILFTCLVITLLACAPDSISSLDELKKVDFILKAEALEKDLERLGDYADWTDYYRNAYMEYVEFPDIGLDLLPADDMVGYKVRYQSDDAEVIGYITAPADYLEKAYPVLLFNRGGNRDYAKNNPEDIYFLAQFGFIVLATQYRGVDGGTGKEEFGGTDLNDVMKLIDLAEMLTFANGKIYMFGWSRGAMQSYIVLSRDDRIEAAVCGAGPTDLLSAYDERGADMKRVHLELIGNPYLVPEEYEARSAIHWPGKINTPLWIVHGTSDERVLVHHSQYLYDDMSTLGKDVKLTLTLYPDMDHSVPYLTFLSDYLYWLKQH